MNPYYEQDGITIYHGDCREVLPEASIDVLITDPPYGVELGTSDSRGGRHGLAKSRYSSYDDTYEAFTDVIVPTVVKALSLVKRGAVFCGKHVMQYPQPTTLGGVYCPAGIGRNPWGYTCFFPILLYGQSPTIQFGAMPTVLYSTNTAEQNGHPCPKPIEWLHWLVRLTSVPGEIVLDPFMGSGTTLVAAKRLGRTAVGIELDERYCEIAARRLSQGVLPFHDAEPEPFEQQMLLVE
jgi:DNA modification methylase